MATWYVDPAATGTGDGTSWADAWTSLQGAMDAWAAGTILAAETVYCRGTETLTTPILAKKHNAKNTPFKIVGVNASGVNDGTNYVLDANSTAASAYDTNYLGAYYHFENITFTGATGAGAALWKSSAASVYKGCCFDSNGTYGADLNSESKYSIFCGCTAHNNGSHGYNGLYNAYMVACSAISNGGNGIYITGASSIIGTICAKNTQYGVRCLSLYAMIYGCVIDGNGSHGVYFENASYSGAVVASRVTNNAGYGIYSASRASLGYVAYYNNTLGQRSGEACEVGAITLTADGYTDRAANNYILAPDAEGRGIDYDIDSTNSIGITAGLQNPEDYPTAAQVKNGVTFNTAQTGTLITTVNTTISRDVLVDADTETIIDARA